MSMKISTRQVDGVTIVDCSGRITSRRRQRYPARHRARPARQGPEENSAEPWRRQLHRQLRHRRTGQRLYHRPNQGGELKLLNLTKKVHDLLQITKLYTVFDVKDDETAAVKSFAK